MPLRLPEGLEQIGDRRRRTIFYPKSLYRAATEEKLVVDGR